MDNKKPSNFPVESQKMSTKSWWIKIRRTMRPNSCGQRHHPQRHDSHPRASPCESQLPDKADQFSVLAIFNGHTGSFSFLFGQKGCMCNTLQQQRIHYINSNSCFKPGISWEMLLTPIRTKGKMMQMSCNLTAAHHYHVVLYISAEKNQMIAKPICHQASKDCPEFKSQGNTVKMPSIITTVKSHSIMPLDWCSPAAIHHMSNGATLTTIKHVNSAPWSGAGRVFLCTSVPC